MNEEPLNSALDAALARALPPPALPADFRARLNAALAREAISAASIGQSRAQLEREAGAKLKEFEADFIRLRRRTLGTLIGGAFAAGTAIALALPWLHSLLGANTPWVLAGVGSALGLAIGIGAWLRQPGAPRLLPRL